MDEESTLPPRAATLSWLAWLVLVLGLGVGVFRANQPVAPRGDAAPVAEFSEARARRVLSHLTNDIGLRLAGTPGAQRGAQDLAAQLRALPGVEVDVQRVQDARLFSGTFVPWPLIAYRVTNVVARIPGRSRDAILLDAHFDSLGDSPGAGDDGVGVASIVETARALAAGPMLERSVIILCNGGEEYGLYGADGFIRHHAWAKDVRAYLYVDGGPGGPATLLYSGPDSASLIEAYAHVAPRPLGSSVYLDLIESGLLSHDGDHRPFRDQNVPGLVFTPIADMWAPHTKLDRYSRVEPGTLQHVGDTLLAVTRELASGAPLPRGIEPARCIYFDVFGAFVLHYRTGTGIVLAVLCSLLALFAARRAGVRRGEAGRALLGSVLAALGGVLAALMAGLVLALVVRRGHGWYATPLIIVPAFVAPACAAACAVHAAWGKRLGVRALWASWATYALGWAGLGLLAALAHARSGYVPLCWSAGLSAGLLAAQRWPARRNAILLLALTPGLYSVLQFVPLMHTLCAQMGLQPLPIPGDPLIATLCGLGVLLAGAALALPVYAFGAARTVIRALSAVTLAGLIASALTWPFTAERPRRVLVTQGESQGRSAFLLRARDALPLDPLLAQLPAARPVRPDWTSFEVFEQSPTHELPAPPPSFAPPSAEVRARRANPDGTRTLELLLHVGSSRVDLQACKLEYSIVSPK